MKELDSGTVLGAIKASYDPAVTVYLVTYNTDVYFKGKGTHQNVTYENMLAFFIKLGRFNFIMLIVYEPGE